MIYKKWRDLDVEPYRVKYKKIKLLEIISYLPAGNDVLECTCDYNNNRENLIIKFERSKMADFDSELRTIKYLKNTSFANMIPTIVEDGIIDNKKYLVLSKINGKRLSEIFKSKKVDRNKYLYEYGKSLAEIHALETNNMKIAKQRVINDIPNDNSYNNIDNRIRKIIDELKVTKPDIKHDTFIHGDYHYANILWRYGKISGILDFEYSGMGFKEQDIAWAIVLRPSQKFMDNIKDIKQFLNGYKSIGSYNVKALVWCLKNAYCHFYLMNFKNKEYTKKILKLISLLDKDVL